ncbi:hypothetical protein NFI96_024043 [Prochilodus magdalenae]|nr:hypothetical protein NFI96_024043 [Prochilodus magdalenae]
MDKMDLMGQLNAVHSASIPCLLLSKLIMVAIPITQIAIVPPKLFLPGAVYLQDCPKQHYIPIYLVVCGVFSIVLALLSCLPCCRTEEGGGNKTLIMLSYIWNGLVSLFMFCWFITGSVWIYSIYPPNYNSTLLTEPYCNKTLYLFAFWTTTVAYILIACLLVAACCALICMCACRGASNA